MLESCSIFILRTTAIYIAVSFYKCTFCKLLWIRVSAKCPKCKCKILDDILSNITILNPVLSPTTSPPAAPLDLQEVESKIEGFKTFTKRLDENIVLVNTTINEFARKQITGFKKEYQRVGQSFKLLGQAFELDQQAYSVGLNQAIAYTGEAYETIGEYFAEQPRQDLDPISDLLDLYRGHLANYPDIIHVQKGRTRNLKERSQSEVAVALFTRQD